MFPFFVEAYPWDVVSRSGQQRLERLRGEVGMTGVAICASMPPFVEMRRLGNRVDVLRSAGGLLYHPQEGAFSSLRCQPIAASIAEGLKAMPRALDVCDQLGLDVRFVASVLRCGGMARRYGELVAVNALGAKSQDCLCASHDDVRAYARNLAGSFRRLRKDSQIVVSDMVSGCDDVLCAPRNCDVTSLDLTRQGLLTWCFCDACVETARGEGVDVDRVQRTVQQTIGNAIDHGVQDQCGDDSDGLMDPAVKAYWGTHLSTVARLFEAIEDAGAGEVVFAEENTCDVWAFPDRSLQVFAGSLEAFGKLCGECGRPVEIVFPAGLSMHGAGLTTALGAAIDAGVPCMTVRHLAMVPEKAIQPLKQAVRFARRAVEA